MDVEVNGHREETLLGETRDVQQSLVRGESLTSPVCTILEKHGICSRYSEA